MNTCVSCMAANLGGAQIPKRCSCGHLHFFSIMMLLLSGYLRILICYILCNGIHLLLMEAISTNHLGYRKWGLLIMLATLFSYSCRWWFWSIFFVIRIIYLNSRCCENITLMHHCWRDAQCQMKIQEPEQQLKWHCGQTTGSWSGWELWISQNMHQT